MSKNLKKDFIAGIQWTGIGKFGVQGIQFITTFILARILSPAEFGLLGLANVFLLIANHINQLGISTAIIQEKDADEAYLSSAFWTNITVGLFLTVSVFFLSWPAAAFFNNIKLRPIMQVLSLVYLIGSLRIVQNALFAKRLQFRKVALLEISSVIISGAVSIGMAVSGFGVWSLIWGQLVYMTTSLLLAWLSSSWRPKFLFDNGKFERFFRFGLNVMCTNILSSVNGSLSTALIGKYLDIVSVGLFNMSMNIIYFPCRFSNGVLSAVMFPVLSHIQDDNKRLKDAYSNVLSAIAVFTFPALVGMACVAPEFVKVILGPKWLGITNLVRVVFVVGMIDSLVATVGSIFCSKGRPDMELKTDAILIFILFPLLFLGLKFGLIGIVIAIAIHRTISLLLFFSVMKSLINYTLKSLTAAVFPAIRDSFLMGMSVMAYRSTYKLFFANDIVLLGSSIVFGAAIYLLCLRWLNSDTYWKLRRIIVDTIKSKITSIGKADLYKVSA